MSLSNVVKVSITNKRKVPLNLFVTYTNSAGDVVKAWSGAPKYIHAKLDDAVAQQYSVTLTDADTTRPYAVELFLANADVPLVSKSFPFQATPEYREIKVSSNTWYEVLSIIFMVLVLAALLGILLSIVWPRLGIAVKSVGRSVGRGLQKAGRAVGSGIQETGQAMKRGLQSAERGIENIGDGAAQAYDTAIFAPVV